MESKLQKSSLSKEHLKEVLFSDDDGGQTFISGVVDKDKDLMVLVRRDFTTAKVPLSIFSPSKDGTTPDFDDFEIIDHGRVIRFGEYEICADAIKDYDI